MYTYAQYYYPRFRAMASYPKLTGNGTWSHRCTTPFFVIEWMSFDDANGKAKAMAFLPAATEFFRTDIPESLARLFSIPAEVSEQVFRECVRELDRTAK